MAKKGKMKKFQYYNNDSMNPTQYPWLLKEEYMLLHRRIKRIPNRATHEVYYLPEDVI